MLADLGGHLQHINGCGADDLSELGVGADHAHLLGVLKVELLDVYPQLLGDGRAGLGLITNNGAKGRINMHGLEKRQRCLALGVANSLAGGRALGRLLCTLRCFAFECPCRHSK